MRRTIPAVLLTLTLGVAAGCGDGGGGGGGNSDKANAARGPIKIWYSNNEEEVTWGKAMVEAWNADARRPEDHRPGDPGRARAPRR